MYSSPGGPVSNSSQHWSVDPTLTGTVLQRHPEFSAGLSPVIHSNYQLNSICLSLPFLYFLILYESSWDLPNSKVL